MRGKKSKISNLRFHDGLISFPNYLVKSETLVHPTSFATGATVVTRIQTRHSKDIKLKCNYRDGRGHFTTTTSTIWLRGAGEILLGEVDETLTKYVNQSSVYWCMKLDQNFKLYSKQLFIISVSKRVTPLPSPVLETRVLTVNRSSVPPPIYEPT